MREITVHTPFNLLVAGATSHQRFDVGTQEVDDEVADHWWTKEHIEADAGDEDEDEPEVDPAAPALPQEPAAGGEVAGGAAQGKVDAAPAPTKDEIKARKAALREEIKALGGTAPNNFASVEAHEAALEAAKAAPPKA